MCISGKLLIDILFAVNNAHIYYGNKGGKNRQGTGRMRRMNDLKKK